MSTDDSSSALSTRRSFLAQAAGSAIAAAVAGDTRPATAAAPAPRVADFRSAFTVGACTHFSGRRGDVAANLSLTRQMGINSIRDDATWAAVENTRGRLEIPGHWDAYIDAARAAGIAPLLILCYGNRFYEANDRPRLPETIEAYCRYAEAVVRHFKGRVHRWEVWNEWDIKIGGTTTLGTAEEYTRVLKAVYPRIKAIDPAIEVIAGAWTSGGIEKGALEGMLTAGALTACDAVSVHAYNFSGRGRGRSPERYCQWMQEKVVRPVAQHGGTTKPLYVTEMGWPNHEGPASTAPAEAAAYLARMYLLSRTVPSLAGVWWYDLQDDGWFRTEKEHNFGLLRPDGTPKSPADALRTIAPLVANAEYLGRVDTGDPDLYLLRFRRPAEKSGVETWAAWVAPEDRPAETWQAILTRPEGARPASPVTQQAAGAPAFERSWGARDWIADRTAPVNERDLAVTLGPVPVLLSGIPSGTHATITARYRPPAPGAPETPK